MLRREVASRFTTAIAQAIPWQPGFEQDLIGAEVLALLSVLAQSVFRDPRFPVFFIETERHFEGIRADTVDALSYGGWFRASAGVNASRLNPKRVSNCEAVLDHLAVLEVFRVERRAVRLHCGGGY